MSGYLPLLDELLAMGLENTTEPFRQAQVNFVLSQQLPDGGFRGRGSSSDLYYADFALRLLNLLQYEGPAWAAVADYLRRLTLPPHDPVQLFNYLNCARLLKKRGIIIAYSPEALLQTLLQQLLSNGGFTRWGEQRVSLYLTFLSALSYEILQAPLPEINATIATVQQLRRADGGYAESPSATIGQTNASAAAIGFFTMHEALPMDASYVTAPFLLRLQQQDGGFLAHPTSPHSDLLSTFTAFLSLTGLSSESKVNIPALGRYLSQLALPGGGFLGSRHDQESDLEYTYYGVGTLALLHGYLMTS